MAMFVRWRSACWLLVFALPGLAGCSDSASSNAGSGGAAGSAAGIVYANDFEGETAGPLDAARVGATWNAPEWMDGVDQGRVVIVDGAAAHAGGKSIRFTFPANTYGSDAGGGQWYMRLPAGYDELYCSYRVAFEAGFDFVQGGYLPGLSGGADATGDTPADGVSGWSARGEFLDGGLGVQNAFYLGQVQSYGDDIPWNAAGDFYYAPGTWYQIEHHIRMNTPGAQDGALEAWVDGGLVLSRQDFVYRSVDTLKIDQFMMASFFGGDDATFAPTREEHVTLDDFVIATEPITH
jgi:hypothetical protein